jgi:hypothetical protein
MRFEFLKRNKMEPVSDNRRQWLVAAGRWSVVALIAGAVGGLWRRGGIVSRRESCADAEGKIGCRKCVYLNDCGHPKALSAKQVIKVKGKKVHSS